MSSCPVIISRRSSVGGTQFPRSLLPLWSDVSEQENLLQQNGHWFPHMKHGPKYGEMKWSNVIVRQCRSSLLVHPTWHKMCDIGHEPCIPHMEDVTPMKAKKVLPKTFIHLLQFPKSTWEHTPRSKSSYAIHPQPATTSSSPLCRGPVALPLQRATILPNPQIGTVLLDQSSPHVDILPGGADFPNNHSSGKKLTAKTSKYIG